MGKNALLRGIERLLIRTPEVPLNSEQILEEVMKMGPGDERTFNFDPNDPKLCSPEAVKIFQGEIAMDTKNILTGSIDVDEKKNKFLYTVIVIAPIWR
ncbi:hypothetical protein A2380_00680 [candidate division WWE3 bacterium RIFOXYB1_FULL_43_24]|uniref:Uncharacterized protein n=2 Tax=Katanobacteria TaxID=422282 RepID=A0A0G1AYS6_UNCKA|nr:MAG: hypothetical protein UU92_C0005G0063 [candidate division WWE3 bacterium GW2011_GWA1_42_12]KKS33953.1 MAG: hypothetical protein UU97_C0017G0005 [candidate division WWE3 bacterium GW2011_GWD1_42_14]KKS39231.1 MAG: hypothetical protein UV00_C0003G0063 [candidate division WWE3 bacterium GW2011_GWF1_42_14]KKS40729.1 MAG: hypothetical protein UV03_C0003G0042 [candidate division WWE3 bacterium GW2011_GWE1_42_16]KKS67091.1 MAG: hypothetical protein UV35_C0003G0002 [candidate division WWE3 bacte